MLSIKALSFAPAARTWMENSRHPRILHVFEHACNLIDERRKILSIVTPGIGNGPFNLVLEEEVLFSAHLNDRSPVSIRANQIDLGNLTIHTADANPWNPQPNWEMLRVKRDDILNQLTSLPIDYQARGLDMFLAKNTLRQAQCDARGYSTTDFQSLFSNLSLALAHVEIASALTLTSQLAGLGGGLTPSGDDFILGALLATWIIHPSKIASRLAGEVTETAAPLTTSLSGAWLRSAEKGEAGIRWHNLFNALMVSDKTAVQESVEQLLAVGHSSGADALAGFTGTLACLRERSNHKIS